MRILERHVLREFITPVLYCFFGFALLYLVIDLFGESDKIVQAKPPLSLVLRYLLGMLAKDLQWLVTPSLLLGGLYSMWQLSRHSEITAMRANGISFISITRPILLTSLLFSLLLYANNEYFAPRFCRDAENIKRNNFNSDVGIEFKNVIYRNRAKQYDWKIENFYPTQNLAKNVEILWYEGEVPVRELKAEEARFVDGLWLFFDAKMDDRVISDRVDKTGDSVSYSPMIIPDINDKPRDMLVEIGQGMLIDRPENLSTRDMIAFTKSHPNLERKVAISWRYDIVNRMIAPIACFVITLFALPAGLATGRQSVFWGVLTAIMMFLIFYVLSIVFGVMAKKGYIPIWLGILTPNLVFLTAGIYLFHKEK